jgi:hypothetical protein
MASPTQRQPVVPQVATMNQKIHLELTKITAQLQSMDRNLGYINGALQKIANRPNQ